MKILLTGASGQIGADLVAALVETGHAVVATDIALPPDAGARGAQWARLDITDRAQVDEVIAHHRPDTVYHLAAILSATGERNPQKTYDVNQTGMYNVLEASRSLGVRQLMFTSTIAVYGPGVPDPAPEDVALRPTTMYGVTKASCEMLCDYYWQRYGFDARGVRFPGLISASLPGGGTSDYALFMYYDGCGRGSYEAFCRSDTRIPLMYMPDALRSLLELSAAPRESLSRCTYNVAAFSPTAEQIADSVRRAVDGVNITFAPDPARQRILDSWPKALDDASARADWGWAPAYDLEQMTADLVPKIREILRAEAARQHA